MRCCGNSGFIPPNATLRVHLLAPLVDFHAFDRGQESPQIDLIPNGVLLQRGEVRARFEISGGSFVVAPDHWHGLRFAEEHTRGYDAEEECFTPGHVDAVADEQGRVDVTINVMPQVPQYDVPSVADSDIPLAQAAADFLVARGHPQGTIGDRGVALVCRLGPRHFAVDSRFVAGRWPHR